MPAATSRQAVECRNVCTSASPDAFLRHVGQDPDLPSSAEARAAAERSAGRWSRDRPTRRTARRPGPGAMTPPELLVPAHRVAMAPTRSVSRSPKRSSVTTTSQLPCHCSGWMHAASACWYSTVTSGNASAVSARWRSWPFSRVLPVARPRASSGTQDESFHLVPVPRLAVRRSAAPGGGPPPRGRDGHSSGLSHEAGRRRSDPDV